MAREKLLQLLNALEKEIEKAEDFANKTREAANEIAKTAAGSWSAAGDREHSRGQAIITQENLIKLRKIKEEIEDFLEKPAPEKAKSICYVSLDFADGRRDSFYLVPNPVYINGYKFVSQTSPLGRALLGKTVGEKFEYEMERDAAGSTSSGKILSIE